MFEHSPLSVALDLADKGYRILWVDIHLAIQSIIQAVEKAKDARISRIHRANRRERIEMFSGGNIMFLAPGSTGHRGHTADALFVHPHVYRDEAKFADLMAVMASPNRVRPEWGHGPVYVLFDRVAG